ncbi:MAG: hypothetical protein AB7I59_17160 [Geminicoccaceae bacterium]
MAMTHLGPAARAIGAPANDDMGHRADDRLPIPQAALLIVAMSLGLWTAIGFGLRWLFA